MAAKKIVKNVKAPKSKSTKGKTLPPKTIAALELCDEYVEGDKGKDVKTGKTVKIGKGDLPTLNRTMNSAKFIDTFSEVFHAVNDGLSPKSAAKALKALCPRGMKLASTRTKAKDLGFVAVGKSGVAYNFTINRSMMRYKPIPMAA